VVLVYLNNFIKGYMDGTNSTTAWTIAGVVALVVVIAGGWLISREKSAVGENAATDTSAVVASADTAEAPSTETTAGVTAVTSSDVPTPTLVAGGETVTVNDQPAGSIVKVESVKLMKPSWVAIMGTNGWVIGAAWFNESRENVEVELLKPTIAGETYQAVIYVDDGDKKFTLHSGDALITSTEGAPVSSTFKAQ
jgi:hypothetical protein